MSARRAWVALEGASHKCTPLTQFTRPAASAALRNLKAFQTVKESEGLERALKQLRAFPQVFSREISFVDRAKRHQRQVEARSGRITALTHEEFLGGESLEHLKLHFFLGLAGTGVLISLAAWFGWKFLLGLALPWYYMRGPGRVKKRREKSQLAIERHAAVIRQLKAEINRAVQTTCDGLERRLEKDSDDGIGGKG